MPYLNDCKECFYSDVYIKTIAFLYLELKKLRKISGSKGGNQIFKFGVEEKRGNQNLSEILGEGKKDLHTMVNDQRNVKCEVSESLEIQILIFWITLKIQGVFERVCY